MTSTQNTPIFQLLLLALGLVCLQAGAQDSSSSATDGPVIPADDFDRGTPRRSAEGLLAALDKGDY
ncbi:MAG: hypothetical protein KAR22_22115, partial [Gammaproteobacteria bacterium]|nr:hypothetical protein [Gammaproteobacteria bacterium]